MNQQSKGNQLVGGEVGFEPFINADEAAQFLSMNRLRVIRAARSGLLPSHPFPRGRGRDWFFLRSELTAFLRDGLHSKPSKTRSSKEVERTKEHIQ